ncbi:MAG: TonB-dependent receptor [Acidiferrobacterales bacterium]|nr:TonB-dependent receptor [Acidiferrobacterales bacterium]
MNRTQKLFTNLVMSFGLLGSFFSVPLSAQELNDANATYLEEIIVTANRREQSIQDVSGVVQSLSSEEIRSDGITELRQLQLAVPGLSIANQEGNVEIFIRGVGSANNTELGDPGAAPHLNGVYIPRPRGLGGMFYDLERVEINKGPQGTLYGRNALAGTLNILTKKPTVGEADGYFQAEALSRGGFGAEGATNVSLSDTSALRISGFYSEKDYGFNNAGEQSLDPAGLQEDLGARITYLNELSDRTSIQIVADYGKEAGTGYPGSNINVAVRDSGLRPEELNLRDVRYRGLQGEMENEIAGFQALITHDFNSMRLQYNGSYRTVDFYQRNAASDGISFDGVNDLDEDNFSGQFWETKSNAFVQEIRLASLEGSRLQWSTGLFGFQEDQEVGFFSLADKGYCCYSGTEFTMPDVEGEAYALYGDLTFDFTDRLRGFGGLRYTDESKSRYGIGGNWALVLGGADFACCVATRLGTEGFDPTLTARPNFDVSGIDTPQEQAQFLIEGIANAGARDTLIQQIQAVANGGSNGECFTRPDIDNGFVTCPEDGFFTYTNLTTPAQQDGSSAFDFVDFRLGLEYDLSDEHMIYGKVSTGHKSGGFNDSFEGLVPEAFEPEDILVFELGSRLSFQAFGYPATLNTTAFHYDYSNQVFQDLTCINFDEMDNECNGFALANRNVGSSELTGIEIESHFNFDGGFALDLHATLLDSEITSGVVADVRLIDFGNGGVTPLIDLSGNRLPLQSDLSITARLQQEIELGSGFFDWQILASYRSDYFLSQFNERDLVTLTGDTRTAIEIGHASLQKGFTTINVGLGYTMKNDKYRFEFYGQNITDEVASQKSIVGNDTDVRFLNDARTFGARAIVNF